MDQGDRRESRLRLGQMVRNGAGAGGLRLQTQEGRDQLQAVLHAVVDLLHQDVLLREQRFLFAQRPRQLPVQAAQADLLAPFEQAAMDTVRSLHLFLRPAARAPAHRLDIAGEGRAGSEGGGVIRLRAGAVAGGLVWVARPFDRLDPFGAEPEQRRILLPQRHGDHAAGVGQHIVLHAHQRGQFVRRDGFVAPLMHPAGDRAQHGVGRAAAAGLDVIAGHQRQAVGVQHLAQFVAGRADDLRQRALIGQPGCEAVLDGA